MRKKLLPLAILAASAEQAGTARPDYAQGIDGVLIYPFYTVGESVSVRMLEGADSQEVIDFNLYLSPFDYWRQE